MNYRIDRMNMNIYILVETMLLKMKTDNNEEDHRIAYNDDNDDIRNSLIKLDVALTMKRGKQIKIQNFRQIIALSELRGYGRKVGK